MEANCGAVSCTVEASPRREAYVRHGPKAPTLAPNSPNGSGSGELFGKRYGEKTQKPFPQPTLSSVNTRLAGIDQSGRQDIGSVDSR